MNVDPQKSRKEQAMAGRPKEQLRKKAEALGVTARQMRRVGLKRFESMSADAKAVTVNLMRKKVA